jgi:hypothetical protein
MQISIVLIYHLPYFLKFVVTSPADNHTQTPTIAYKYMYSRL